MEENKIVQSDELDSEIYWKGIQRDTDLWFKSQLEGIKKAKPYLESLGLDAEEIIWQFEYKSEFNKNRLIKAGTRLVSNLCLVKSGKEPLEFRWGEIIDDLTEIGNVLSKDSKVDVIFDCIVNSGKEDASILGVDCSDLDFSSINFEVLQNPRLMPETLVELVQGSDTNG